MGCGGVGRRGSHLGAEVDFVRSIRESAACTTVRSKEETPLKIGTRLSWSASRGRRSKEKN